VSLLIQNKTRQTSPKVKFELIKNEILGERFELSLVFCGQALSRRLNNTYRGKNSPTNVLSFPLDKNSGEIFLDLGKIKSETKKFGMNFSKLTAYLFIHGCLHLKGMEHGAKMDELEHKFLNGATNRSWY
jgi:probable rRNA maturation factor